MKKEKLKEGVELIYTDGLTLMEKLKVESIDKKNSVAILSNRVKVSRIPDLNGNYPRVDRGGQYCMPLNEESEKVFETYRAYHSIRRSIEDIQGKVKNKDLDPDKAIKFARKLNKLMEGLSE